MRVLLKAYLTGNVGDDLMVRILCQRYPTVWFTVVGRERFRDGFADLKNLDYIAGDEILHKVIGGLLRVPLRSNLFGYAEILLLTRQFDAYIILGGSMFIESSATKKKCFADKLWLKKRPYIVGCNFGPYTSTAFLDFYQQYFSNCKGITTREHSTQQLFNSLSNIKWAPDVVFSLNNKGSNVADNGDVLVSVIGYEKTGIPKTKYLSLLLNILGNIRNEGYTPVLMSFCESEGDEAVIDELLSESNPDTQVIRYSGKNIQEVLVAMQHAHCVVAGRFHAMILAFVYHKRCLPVVYSGKMEHVLTDVGFTDPVCVLYAGNPEADMSVLKSETYFTIDENYLAKAKEQFYYLDKALK